ncbi:MAG: type IVB secretion system protein IcmM/DotJ [Legionellales bacterium]|nr:type IVB secretion system protein IcmM/DotJ [Legionellales bacterium]
MSRETWSLIKQSKRFYVQTYRGTGTTLFISMLLNLCLGSFIYYIYFNQPDPAFYATSGIIPPILLTPMDSANNTSVAMLADDPVNEDDTRAIPQ